MSIDNASDNYRREARDYAIERIKQLFSDSIARADGPLNISQQLRDAIDALPDFTKVDALPEAGRKKIYAVICQLEINFLADRIGEFFCTVCKRLCSSNYIQEGKDRTHIKCASRDQIIDDDHHP